MGRLKQDHSGYHTSGMWLKYKTPSIDDGHIKVKSKKDTKKWCRGKPGTEHTLIRIFYRTQGNGKYFDWEYWNGRLFPYTETMCTNCGKRFRNNQNGAPLIIPIKYDSEEYPIQVRVDGKVLPIDPRRFLDQHYCWNCWIYHTYADKCIRR